MPTPVQASPAERTPSGPGGRHYLDHASSVPLRPEAAEAMVEWATRSVQADPGRPYAEGRIVRGAIEGARDEIASFLGARPREVVFTSGGTEAANWANLGAREKAAPSSPILLAGVEHSCVRRSAEASGPTVLLRVDPTGRIEPGHLRDVLGGPGLRPALVHCQSANHEVGTVQPVEEVVGLCSATGIPVHVDACTSAGHLHLDCASLGADFVSVSAHKLGGPPGIGALVLRRGTRIAPLLLGAEQERARRAGTENVVGIVGFAAAVRALGRPGALAEEAARARRQTGAVLEAATSLPGVTAYGDVVDRVPHLVCLGVDGVEAEGVVLALDQAGIAVHSGSACSSEAFEPSPVLEAMGVDAARSLRVSVGWSTTDEDIAAFISAFPVVVAALRALGSPAGT